MTSGSLTWNVQVWQSCVALISCSALWMFKKVEVKGDVQGV